MSKGIGDAVIRPLKNALDDMPVHVRQLSDMFRKHGQKQNRNTNTVTDLDGTNVPEALRDGWKKDTDWTPNDVVDAGWGDRPEPGEYLDADYIEQHLARFDDGASRIYFSEALHTFGPGQRDHATFVFPTSELQKILDETGGNAHEVAERLGIDAQYFHIDNDLTNPLKDVEIRHFAPEELTDLRMPSGNESGANENWIAGGYLPTGIPEAVFNVPETATGYGPNFDGDYNPGMWPGTANALGLHL